MRQFENERRHYGTFCANPTAMYSPDGGANFIGRAAHAPQLHRARAPRHPLSAGKRAAPTAAEGAQPWGKATAQSPPSTETRIVPVSKSTATPSVLPAANQPAATASL